MATKCQICNIELSSEAVLKEHSKGRKHIRLEQNYLKQKEKSNSSVFVCKLRSNHNELALYKYFEQFGPLKEVILDKNKGQFAFVHFKDPRHANHVLQKNYHSISGSVVEVHCANPKISKKPNPNKDKEDDSSQWPFYQIFNEMYRQECVTDQLYVLMCRLELTEEEIRKRNNFFISLQDAIRNYLPNSRFEPYGSSVSGLGTHNCDADIFLNVSQVTEKLWGTKVNDRSVGNLVEHAMRWNFGNNQMECLQSVKFILKGVSQILRRQIPYVKKVMPILSARCPIVKFEQSAIGLQVDISMTNRLGIANSRLTRFFTMLDNRVKTYLYAVRSFTKIKKIAGNAPVGQFSSYAITMLAIFVLQRLRVPVLPTVDLLRRWADPFDRIILDGWDCSFTTNINNVPRNSNSLSVAELFYEFCDFVSLFNFRENVICLRTAEIMSRDDFGRIMDRQLELKDFKIMKPVCIQDPFDLSHNVAISVSFETMERITKECSWALNVMRKETWKPSNERHCWGFPLLLQQTEGESK